MKTTQETTAPRGARKVPARTVRKSQSGNLSRPEITKLVLQAQEAYHYQAAMGNVAAAMPFDAWRRDQVMAAVGLGGISQIGRVHWREVFAHFLILSGRPDEAYLALQSTGPKRDHGPEADTHESSEALVHKMRETLDRHAREILPAGQTHIHPGWLLAAVRQRTGKHTLTLDTLAERLAPATLAGLLAHLRNHVARREGRATDRRAKRVYPPLPDPGQMHVDSGDPF